MNQHNSFLFSFTLLTLLFLLTACHPGHTVTPESPTFVDNGSAGGFDANSISETNPSADIRAQTDIDFEPPPENYTANATISIAEKQALIGKDAVKVWVWNDLGSQEIVIPEGSAANILKLKVTIAASIISSENGGSVQLLVNGARAETLGMREETKVGSTWVFVSDMFLNAPEK